MFLNSTYKPVTTTEKKTEVFFKQKKRRFIAGIDTCEQSVESYIKELESQIKQ